MDGLLGVQRYSFDIPPLTILTPRLRPSAPLVSDFWLRHFVASIIIISSSSSSSSSNSVARLSRLSLVSGRQQRCGRQLDGPPPARSAEMRPVSATSSRSTVVAATFWLVVLLGNNLSASLFSGRRVRLQDLYSANGKSSMLCFFRATHMHSAVIYCGPMSVHPSVSPFVW